MWLLVADSAVASEFEVGDLGMRIFASTIFAVVATFSASALAAPVTWDFTGSGGNLGVDEVFTSGASSLTATAINSETPPSPQLNQTSSGLGVNLGFFDNNELDNTFNDEAIVFDFGSLYSVSSIGISSAGPGFFPEDDFEIYGTNDASVLGCTTGGLTCLTGVSTLLLSDSGNGVFGLSGIFRYIIATVPGGFLVFGDDYRVSSLTAMAVPVPAALPLFATGLAVLGFAAHRRRRRRIAQG